MNGRKQNQQIERGATLAEMAIGATVFFTAVFAILEFSRLLWTHNALTDAAQRGARYAAISSQNTTNVKNMVVYGVTNPSITAQPEVSGLMASNVEVIYSNFGVKQGTVSVRITGYQFSFSVPLIGTTLAMPDYKTTLTGESAGYAPSNL